MKNVYDDESFFKQYKELRSQNINANKILENPMIKLMLPQIQGKKILDLGCGDGNMDKYFVYMGAEKVVALDISKKMINEAKKINKDERIEYYNIDMEDLSYIDEKFDIVYSSLAFHYVEDFNKLISEIARLLNPNGILLFSQENPLKTALTFSTKEQKNKVEINGKRYYLISDYQNEGVREKLWYHAIVTKYHRTFSTIINTLISNNFNILEVRDSNLLKPADENTEKYLSEIDCPDFLFVKAQLNNIYL